MAECQHSRAASHGKLNLMKGGIRNLDELGSHTRDAGQANQGTRCSRCTQMLTFVITRKNLYLSSFWT